LKFIAQDRKNFIENGCFFRVKFGVRAIPAAGIGAILEKMVIFVESKSKLS